MKRMLAGLLLCLLLGCSAAATETPEAPVETLPPTSAPQQIEVSAPTAAPTAVPSPVPTPTATPSPSPTPTPTPTPTPSPTPEPTPFSVIWLPDTQQLAYKDPDRLAQIGAWIAAHRAEENAVLVVHTGDIVDNGFKDWEWDNFDLALSQFRDDLPFFPVAGNHDIGVNLQKYTAYVRRGFLDRFPDEQKFQGGEMLYDVLDAGGQKVLLLGIGWDKGKKTDEKRWLDEVMARYGELPCILITHGYLTDQKRILPSCRYLETNVVAKYPNVRLVLSGHSREYYSQAFEYDDDGDGTPDRTVHAMMLNKQGKAYCFRVLTFDPMTHAVQVRTVSPDPDTAVTENKDLGAIDFTIENAY